VVPLTSKFPLADAEAYSGSKPGSFTGDLAASIKAAALQINEKRGKTHSSDEGLA